MIKQTWIALVLSILVTQAGQVIVDRTDRHSQTYLGPPGMSGKGSTEGDLSPKLNLPIRIDATQAEISADENLILSLRITNTGTVPLKIPLSFDQAKVHAAGASNRMELGIFIGIASNSDPSPPLERKAVAGLSSSDAFPDSYENLAPNASFILRISAPSKALDVHAGDEIYLFARTTKLFDSKYFIEAFSDMVTSKNSIKVAKPSK